MPEDHADRTQLGLHPAATAGICALTTIVGAALGVGADALLGWLEATFDTAPGLLKVAAGLPRPVTIAVLTIAGLAVGLKVVGDWQEETLVCEIHDDGVQTRLHKRLAWVAREKITSVYVDGEELVLAGEAGRMLAVGKVDGVGPVRAARTFREAGYPWSDGGHPHEKEFRPFVDGRDDLDDAAAKLLRARATALADGAAARARDLRAELSAAGVLVRDRRGEQQYALLSDTDKTS